MHKPLFCMDFGFFHAVNTRAEAVMPNSVTAFIVS
jgi:hypothetical protein